MGGRNGVGLARRKRSDARSHARACAGTRNLASMTDEWFALLFDVARGAHVGPLPRRAATALEARGLVDSAGGVTRAGYLRLMARRLDPIAEFTDDAVQCFVAADAVAVVEREDASG